MSKEENWELEFTESGQLIASNNNIGDVLKVLNNDRLKSPINNEAFDVDVKEKYVKK